MRNFKSVFFLGLGTFIFLTGFVSREVSEIESALLRKDFQQVEHLSTQLLTVKTASLEAKRLAQYYLALSQLNQNKYSIAVSNLEDLLKDRLNDQLKNKVQLALFDGYYLDEKYEDALKTAETLLKSKPASDYTSLIYLKKAKAHLKLAQWLKAKESLLFIINNFSESLEVPIAKQLLTEEQYFTVQIGSFNQRDRAEQLVSELKQKGEYVYIVETSDQQNNKFYRVRVGQLAQLNEAQKLKKEMSKLGYPAQIFP